MKILWLSHFIPYPPKGGMLQRSYNLLRETCKHHDVSVIAFTQTHILKSMFPSISDGLSEAREHLSTYCKNITFIDIPSEQVTGGKYLLAIKSLFTKTPYTINWLISDKMKQAIKAELQRQNFDIIHFDTISLASYAPLFGETPKVLDHHNIESHMMLRRAKQEMNPLKKLYYHQEGLKLLAYEKNVCRFFDYHITCSPLDSERLLQISPDIDVDEIPNGVDLTYFQPCYENELENRIVFAGGLSWYPNKDAMLYFTKNVWPILKSKQPDIQMDVIGKHPPKELIHLSLIDPTFHVHGFVDDVRKYLSRATVYVCPIRDGGGTKLKLLDAFSMGKAVISHPNACEGIDVTDGRNVLLASTPAEFAEQLIYAINNKDKRREIGKNARELVQSNYSFQEIGKKLSAAFDKLGNGSISRQNLLHKN